MKPTTLVTRFFLFQFSLACSTSTSLLPVGANNASSEYPNPGCPCIDSSSTLEIISNCETRRGVKKYPGVLLGDGTCAPFDYGANDCSTYDYEILQECSSNNPPAFCKQSWCFVDRSMCRNTHEQVFKSSFPGLFYSYSTCGSSAQDWLDFKTINALSNRTLLGVVPELRFPRHYKVNPANTSQLYKEGSPEAYDESIPYHGVFIDYLNAVIEVSNIHSIRLVHRSRGSQSKVDGSAYTKATTDVSAEVADLVVSGVWGSAKRFAMASTSIPFARDPIYLWIPQPGLHTDNLGDSAQNILLPFSTGLWFATLGTIFAFAIGTILVSPDRHRVFGEKPQTVLEKTKKACIILTDACNTAFLEFLGRGVDHRTNANSSQKLLNIGFAFFIFVTATAYTANTAAFLTRAQTNDYLSSIQHAIADNTRICAHAGIKEELELLYPTANFIFRPESMIVLQAYEEGKCEAMVLGWFYVPLEPTRQEILCRNNLIRVGHPILEKTIVIPVKKDLQAGLSHWMSQAASEGITIDSFISQENQASCDLDVILTPEEASDLQQLTPRNLMLPLLVFAVASAAALIIHLAKLLRRTVHEDKNGSISHGTAEKQPAITSASSGLSDDGSITSGNSAKQKVPCQSSQLFSQQELEDLLQNCQQQHALLQSLLGKRNDGNTHEC